MSAQRVVQFGLGTIGSAIARLVVERDDLLLVGAIDADPRKTGVDVSQLLKLDRPTGVAVDNDVRGTLARVQPDLVLHATGSRIGVVADQLLAAMDCGADVVSTCEELAFPYVDEPAIASRLDDAAQSTGCRLIGAGVNPGFVMDVLPLVLSAVCARVDRVTVVRVVDTSQRRPQLRAKTGAGLSPSVFQDRVARGEIGHVGLVQSVRMIAEALGWTVESVAESIDARLAEEAIVVGREIDIAAGVVAGLRQRATGRVEGVDRVTLDLTMEAGAQEPRDEVRLYGQPPVRLVIPGGVSGDIATSSIVVNVASRLRMLAPGLRTMLDMFPVRSGGEGRFLTES